MCTRNPVQIDAEKVRLGLSLAGLSVRKTEKRLGLSDRLLAYYLRKGRAPALVVEALERIAGFSIVSDGGHAG